MKTTIQPPSLSFIGNSVLNEQNVGCFFKIIDCPKPNAQLYLGKIIFVVKLQINTHKGDISIIDLRGYEWSNEYDHKEEEWIFEKLNVAELKFILE